MKGIIYLLKDSKCTRDHAGNTEGPATLLPSARAAAVTARDAVSRACRL